MSGDLTLNLLIAVVTLAMIFLIPAAVFAGVLFKVGWDVFDRDYIYAYFSRGWMKSLNRNFQLLVILLTTLVTVLLDLNIAVLLGTIIFYLVQKLFKSFEITDVEAELEEGID